MYLWVKGDSININIYWIELAACIGTEDIIVNKMNKSHCFHNVMISWSSKRQNMHKNAVYLTVY